MALIKRLQNILLTPQTEWQAIKREPLTIAQFYGRYFFVYAALPAAGHLLSFLSTSTWLGGLRLALISYVVWLLTLNFSAGLIARLAPTFASTSNSNLAFRLVAFSVLPMLVAGLLMFIPNLGLILSVVGLAYSAYLCYLGLPIMLQTSNDKLIPFTVTVLVTVLVVYFVQMALLGRILGVTLSWFF